MGGRPWCMDRPSFREQPCRRPICGPARGWCWRDWWRTARRSSIACITSIAAMNASLRSCAELARRLTACTRQLGKQEDHSVRFPRFNALIAIAALLVAPSGPSVSSPSAPSHRTIFAVWPGEKGKQPDAAILDPVVIIDASTFANPMQYNNEDESHAQADFDRFLKDYLQPGQKYQLLFGGSHRGEVVVDQPAGISCETLKATLKAPVPFVNGQKALATTSVEGLGLHSNWRKPATPEQRAAFLVLAAGLLAKHGWSAASQSAIGVRNLRATKLGAGRSEALIGSVTVKEKIAIHNLFLAAEHREGRW